MSARRRAGRGAEWLGRYQLAFRTLANMAVTVDADAMRWFQDCETQCTQALTAVRDRQHVATIRPSTVLWIPGARPRSMRGQRQSPLDAYLAFDAKVSWERVLDSSIKLGLLNHNRTSLRLRVQFDYDSAVNHDTLSSFPFHVHFGKRAVELGSGIQPRYDAKMDEPRLPSFPVDIFHVMQLVHEQFQQPALTGCFQSAELAQILVGFSTDFLDKWIDAMRQIDGNTLVRSRGAQPIH